MEVALVVNKEVLNEIIFVLLVPHIVLSVLMKIIVKNAFLDLLLIKTLIFAKNLLLFRLFVLRMKLIKMVFVFVILDFSESQEYVVLVQSIHFMIHKAKRAQLLLFANFQKLIQEINAFVIVEV